MNFTLTPEARLLRLMMRSERDIQAAIASNR
jgi:hypothetical protein